MGLSISKQEIDLDKNLKFDLILEISCSENKNKKCNTVDNKLIKKYLKNNFWQYLNSIGEKEYDSLYFTGETFAKKETKKVKLSKNLFVVSFDIFLGYKTSPLYIEDFQKEMLTILKKRLKILKIPFYKKIKSYEVNVKSIENLVNI